MVPGPGEHVLGRAKARKRGTWTSASSRGVLDGLGMESVLTAVWQDASGLTRPVWLYSSIRIWQVSRRVWEGLKESVSIKRASPVQREDLLADVSGTRLPQGKVRSDWKQTDSRMDGEIGFEQTRVFLGLMPM